MTRKLTGRWVLHPIQARPSTGGCGSTTKNRCPKRPVRTIREVCEALISRRWFWALLAGIAVFGFVLRVWNLDFDQRQHLNPDERYWALTSAELDRAEPVSGYPTPVGPVLDWLDADRSPANPYRVVTSFNYGPLPLAMSPGVAGWLQDGAETGTQPANAIGHTLDAVGLPLLDPTGTPRSWHAYQVDLIGRLLGAIFDSFTLLLVGIIGRRFAGALAGLAAAGLYACSVLAIQLTHFLGAEPMLGMACALTVPAALSLDRSASARAAIRSGAVLGAASGFAVATKLTALGLVAVPIIGCAALVVRHRRSSDVVRLAAVGIGALVSFRILHPGTFTGLGMMPSDAFLADLRASRALASSSLPPSFQWSRRIPILQPNAWLFVFTVGPASCLAALAGAVVVVRRRWSRLHERGRWPVLVLFGAVLVPFLYIEITSLPTGRYYVPKLPALYVLAGTGVAYVVHRARATSGHPRTISFVAVVGCVMIAALWGAAFVNGVYGHTNTRIEASHWIVDHVPDGSVLTSQAWDDGLPLAVSGIDPQRFSSEQLDMVGPDDEAKVTRIVDQLQRVDYVVESSPRTWGTVVRLPARFASTINFFEALDTGELGFERAATFRSRPRLGPFVLDDSWPTRPSRCTTIRRCGSGGRYATWTRPC